MNMNLVSSYLTKIRMKKDVSRERGGPAESLDANARRKGEKGGVAWGPEVALRFRLFL